MFKLANSKLCFFIVSHSKTLRINKNVSCLLYSFIKKQPLYHNNYLIRSYCGLPCHGYPRQSTTQMVHSFYRIKSVFNRILTPSLRKEYLITSRTKSYRSKSSYFPINSVGRTPRFLPSSLVGESSLTVAREWRRHYLFSSAAGQTPSYLPSKRVSHNSLPISRLWNLNHVTGSRSLSVPFGTPRVNNIYSLLYTTHNQINLHRPVSHFTAIFDKSSLGGSRSTRLSSTPYVYHCKNFSSKVGTNSDPQPAHTITDSPSNKDLKPTSSSNDKKPETQEFEVKELLHTLTIDQRRDILIELQLEEAAERKRIAEEKLASWQWRSKFGRPTSVYPSKVDPSGTYCEIPQDWLMKKVAESVKVKPPTWSELRQIAVFNALPFVGFGFLDNLIMIVAGDYIDTTIGIYLGISTMAAAALGNTISDLAGIGSAWYVEYISVKIGVRAPDLTQEQQDTSSARWSANIGRGAGVCLGCILGMFPLLLLSDHNKGDTKRKHKNKEESPSNKEESLKNIEDDSLKNREESKK